MFKGFGVILGAYGTFQALGPCHAAHAPQAKTGRPYFTATSLFTMQSALVSHPVHVHGACQHS